MEGCQLKGPGDFFQGGGTGGADIRVRDVGADPPHGTGPGKFSTQGYPVYNRETAEEIGGGGVVILTASSIDGGGGI